jgi:hypothetical protein
MKHTKFNEIHIYVDMVVNFRNRDVRIKWTTEDGLIEDDFDSVFIELNENDYDQAYDDFIDEFPIFNLNVEGLENA